MRHAKPRTSSALCALLLLLLLLCCRGAALASACRDGQCAAGGSVDSADSADELCSIGMPGDTRLPAHRALSLEFGASTTSRASSAARRARMLVLSPPAKLTRSPHDVQVSAGCPPGRTRCMHSACRTVSSSTKRSGSSASTRLATSCVSSSLH